MAGICGHQFGVTLRLNAADDRRSAGQRELSETRCQDRPALRWNHRRISQLGGEEEKPNASCRPSCLGLPVALAVAASRVPAIPGCGGWLESRGEGAPAHCRATLQFAPTRPADPGAPLCAAGARARARWCRYSTRYSESR